MMPCTSTAAALPNQAPLAHTFLAAIIRGVRRREARARREQQLIGIPHRFSHCLRETSRLTGLPVPMLRRLARAQDIEANKINGWP
jgi:hypothetical protein